MQRHRLTGLALGLAALFAFALFVSTGDNNINSARTILESENSKRDFISMYDYVVVGAGPAGISVATKLAKNSRYSVLLIEAGEANFDDANIAELSAYSGGRNTFLNNSAPSNDGRYSWPTFLQPDKSSFGARNLIGSGKTLGGSGAINAGMYIVGGSYVWDKVWPASWSYSVMKPYVQSLTNWLQPYVSATRTAPTIEFLKAFANISLTQQRTSADNFFINRATGAGTAHVEDPAFPNSVNYNDVNGLNSVVAFGQYQTLQKQVNATYFKRVYGGDLLNDTVIDRTTGRGKGAYSSLTVMTDATAKRILFRSPIWNAKPKAVGLEVFADGKLSLIVVNKEVIITAGTFFSPGLLQRSGVGNCARLAKIGVSNCVYNNPLVGANFRNHYSPCTTVTGLGNVTQVTDFFAAFNSPMPGYGFLRGGAFAGYHNLDPSRVNATDASPRKYQLFMTVGTTVVSPRIQSQYDLSPFNSLTLIADNINFNAYGSVEITHPTDPTAIPNILYTVFPSYTFNASQTPASQFAAAAKTERNSISCLLGLNIWYQTITQMNAQLASQGKNFTLTFQMPLNVDLKTFHDGITRLGANWYQKIWSWNPASTATPEDATFFATANKVLNVMRASAHLDSHQNGSNKMGDVVDEKLKVIGVDGVRVADLSVSAEPAGGNTVATAFLIGSRAADIIIASQ